MSVFQFNEGACLAFAFCTGIGVPTALHMWWSQHSAASRLHTPAQHLQKPNDPRELGVSNGLQVLKVACQLQTFCSGCPDILPLLQQSHQPINGSPRTAYCCLSLIRLQTCCAGCCLHEPRPCLPAEPLSHHWHCVLCAAYWCLSMVRRGRCKSWPGRPLHAVRVLMRLSLDTFSCADNVHQCPQSSRHCLRLRSRVPPRHCRLSPLHSAKVHSCPACSGCQGVKVSGALRHHANWCCLCWPHSGRSHVQAHGQWAGMSCTCFSSSCLSPENGPACILVFV